MGCTNSTTLKGERMNKAQYREALRSSVVIQKWFRRYKARLEAQRRCTWKIFESIEYSEEQDQQNLYNFFNEMVEKVSADSQVSQLREVLLNGNSALNSDASEEGSIIAADIESTVVSPSYEGPHVEMPLTLDKTREILDHFKRGRILHAKYVKRVIWEATKRVQKLPNVVNANLRISKQITICGDIHGKLDDLLTVFHKNGLPSSDNPYLFNGDFVDRGAYSIEVLIILCCFYLMYPSDVYLNRGNHEDYLMNSRYGFVKEIQNKYKKDAAMIKELCKNLFTWLPLATIVSKRIFVAHGGISDKTDLNMIESLKRYQFASVLKPSHIVLEEGIQPNLEAVAEWEQILDLLWSDPQSDPGRVFNHSRGGGCFFGPDITEQFLKKHNMDLIIRSHECKYEGYEYAHSNTVLTVFSASHYYAEGSNYGAYLKLNESSRPFPVQFAVTRGRKSLSLKQIVGLNEQSALRELRERFFYHREELLAIFQKYDTENTGSIKLNDWAYCLESVLHLKLPWALLREKLVATDDNGNILYMTCLEGYKFDSAVPQQLTSLSEVLYRNRSALETVFRLIDKDCSGCISLEEFKNSCEVLNQFSNHKIPPDKINDLARALDINRDGLIDFNEFLEAFRLVSQSMEQNDV
ncbi:serine/threonine-protein phosphatase with EF-hands 2-like [Rhopilema esculentum]|uniref:serine/threonine-protein phosphatase with EF-hands 2-like n=1 Tax=Rhopilema esculentum TaxID=499914 RepID=UPI0031DC3211